MRDLLRRRGTHAGQTIYAAIDWRPEEPFPLFAVDIHSAAYISFGRERKALRWSPATGLKKLRHPDDPAEGGG